MGFFRQLGHALALTLKDQALNMIPGMVTTSLTKTAVRALGTQPSRYLTARAARRSLDGATLGEGVPVNAYAKYALRKGLPGPGQRVLAIENDPHSVNDFSGEIPSGYGAGVKTLLSKETVVIKVKGKSFLGKMNYHAHQAKRAGLHYDLVVEGLPPGTDDWELHVPRGVGKGRYAFHRTERGMLVTPMVDRGVQRAKPQYTLRDRVLLEKAERVQTDWQAHASIDGHRVPVNGVNQLDSLPVEMTEPWICERKEDGSLANAWVDQHYRAAFRSHREGGETYYDRLPAVEFLGNRSRVFLNRYFFPGPKSAVHAQFAGELVHPDGSSRTSGILNSLPANAQAIQLARGPVEYHVWDIVKYKGRDVSHLPYAERRMLYQELVQEIRRFNVRWQVIERAQPGENLVAFYERVTHDPLPYGEGIVLKRANQAEPHWDKIKQTGFRYLRLIRIEEGQGKYKNTVGRMVVENRSNRARGEIGSFAIPDDVRQWIWDHREDLEGSVIKARVQEISRRGAPRAGVFLGFHGGEEPLLMYAESLAGGDPKLAKSTRFAIKSAAGWRK